MTTMAVPAVPDAGLLRRTGLSYGVLAAPLAFVSLPLYVSLPHHYATAAGAPLAALGAVLLAVRALDALVDPALGKVADRLLGRGTAGAWRAAALGSAVLCVGFALLWHPPAGDTVAVLVWLAATLLVSTLAHGFVVILHQAWGTRWGGAPAWRARVSAWREAATLVGVVLASVLPGWIGFTATSAVLAVLLGVGLAALSRLGRSTLPEGQAPVLPVTPVMPVMPVTPGPVAAARSPWADAAFRRLLAVFMVNGIAAAVPATLLPFFVADRLQAPEAQPMLLLAYFGAAALGLPWWVRTVARLGLAPAWRLGMLASVLAFAATPFLGPGDSVAFAAVCVASGLALGADLALPAALLTGVIHQAGAGQRAEGVYLGWWSCATKLNLALAAGLALPLLALVGYRPGGDGSVAGASGGGAVALAWVYGGLPCLLKLVAAALLWRAERLHPGWREKA